jgi:hypothetical protein
MISLLLVSLHISFVFAAIRYAADLLLMLHLLPLLLWMASGDAGLAALPLDCS